MSSKYIPWSVKTAIFRINLKYNYLLAPTVRGIACPICDNREAKLFRFGPDRTVTGPSRRYPEIAVGHDKYCCTHCRNIFATWLQRDVSEVGEIYAGIDEGDSEVHLENDRKEVSKEMMRICASLLRAQRNERTVPIRILDFGCGPNYRGVQELHHEDTGLELTCCDVNPNLPYDGKTFFRFTGVFPSYLHGMFDGIASVDVFEHLNYPVQDMMSFNRLLRTGGIMVHYAPLQWCLRLRRGHYETAFHTNFPSKKSLKILCDKTGFEFLGDAVPKPGYWYLMFRKVAHV
ncbi:MAG: class I SAM-dependent methyltransferase [Nitrospirota bacterium]